MSALGMQPQWKLGGDALGNVGGSVNFVVLTEEGDLVGGYVADATGQKQGFVTTQE